MTNPMACNDPVSGCVGKERFGSARLAHDIARKRPRGNRQPYRCDFCAGWHLGAAPRTAHIRIRRGAQEADED